MTTTLLANQKQLADLTNKFDGRTPGNYSFAAVLFVPLLLRLAVGSHLFPLSPPHLCSTCSLFGQFLEGLPPRGVHERERLLDDDPREVAITRCLGDLALLRALRVKKWVHH
eukprot:scaffold1236_cov170-Ochromonas_danica.AAC.15